MHGFCLQLNNLMALVISKVSTESNPLKEQVNESTVPKKVRSTTDQGNESMSQPFRRKERSSGSLAVKP